MVLVAVLIAVPLLDGLGVITLKEGTGWLIAQIAVATAVPVAIAAMKTTDFFREEPKTIADLERRHAAHVAKLEALQDEAIAQLTALHQKREHENAVAILEEKKKSLKLARELEFIRNPPKTVSGVRITQEEFKQRYPDE